MASRKKTIPRVVSVKKPGPPKKPKAQGSKAPTKSEMLSYIANKTNLTEAQATAMFNALVNLIGESLSKFREFTIPGLLKIKLVHKKATPARPGRNPATGEQITIRAKPARDVVRVAILKHLKEMA